MQFLVLAYDFRDSEALTRRMEARAAHVALGNEMRDAGKLHFGAAILDGEDHMIGSMYVCEFACREDLDAWLEREPYVRVRVWEKIEIQPCKIGPSFTRGA